MGNGSAPACSSVVSSRATVMTWTAISATDHFAVTRTRASGTDDTSAVNRSHVVRRDSRTAFHWACVTEAFTGTALEDPGRLLRPERTFTPLRTRHPPAPVRRPAAADGP
jgi:hypothetical protein